MRTPEIWAAEIRLANKTRAMEREKFHQQRNKYSKTLRTIKKSARLEDQEREER